MELASAVHIKFKVGSLVISSELLDHVSLLIETTTGLAGAVVSIVTSRESDTGETFPAVSVSVEVISYTSSGVKAGVAVIV